MNGRKSDCAVAPGAEEKNHQTAGTVSAEVRMRNGRRPHTSVMSPPSGIRHAPVAPPTVMNQKRSVAVKPSVLVRYVEENVRTM